MMTKRPERPSNLRRVARLASHRAIEARHVFLITLLVYLLLLPRFVQAWRKTGDEPHYLTIVRSIVRDRDIDLANNYDQLPHRHVIAQPDGTWRPRHGIGLPLLLAVPYILGGEFGVHVFLAILGATTAAKVFTMAYEMTGRRPCGTLSWLVFSFLSPGFFYSFLIYPELVGSLIVIHCLGQLWQRRVSLAQWASIGVLIAFLPWLVIRFAPLAAWIGILGLWQIFAGNSTWPPDRKRVLQCLCLCIPVLVSALSYVYYLFSLYGSTSPLSVYGSPSPITRPFQRASFLWLLFGFLFDQRMGLLVFSPVLVTSVAGLVLWTIHGSSRQRIVTFTALFHMLSLAPLGGFWVEWSIPTRYLVVVLPLLCIVAAASLLETRSRVYRAIALVLAGVSLLNVAVVFSNQELGYGVRSHSRLYAYYSSFVGVDLREILPQLTDQWVNVNFRAGHSVLENSDTSVDDIETETRSAASDRARTVVAYGPLQVIGISGLEITSGKTELRLRIAASADEEPRVAVREVTLVVGPANGDQTILVEELTYHAGTNNDTLHFTLTNPARQHLEVRIYASDPIRVSEITAAFLPGLSRMYGWDRLLVFAFLTAVLAVTCIRGYAGPGSQSSRPSVTAKGPSLVTAILTVLILGAILMSWLRTTRGVYYAQDLPSRVGTLRLSGQASWLLLVCGTPDRQGAVMYGPYKAYPEGTYEAVFWILFDAPNGVAVGQIDVHAANDGRILAEHILRAPAQSGELRPYQLPFRLETTDELEFRVWYYGHYELCVDRVELIERLPVGPTGIEVEGS